MIQGIDYDKRIANDFDSYIVSLMSFLSRDLNFDKWAVAEELYNQVKADKESYPPELVAFLGYGCSFGGKWFGGYARGGQTSKGTPRNHAQESLRNVYKLAPKLKGIEFHSGSYKDLDVGEGNVIYCDIPYKDTTKYKSKFNHDEFYEWARENGKTNHLYISEYQMPDDFKVVWEKEHKTGIHHGFKEHEKRIERLFKYEQTT